MVSFTIYFFMKIGGKILLFISSYLPVWIIWIVFSISTQGLNLNILLSFGIVLTIISFLTGFLFKKTYETANRDTISTITITSISNGSSEAISYLLTLIIPVATSTIPLEIFGGNFNPNIIVTLVIGIAIFFIYLRSNLVVMNPTMMLFGYSLYVINYKTTEESEITFDAVLITAKQFGLEEISSKNNVTRVDEGVYLL
jgi:hypothetical protein